jgi:hypothetical protein
MTTEIPRNKWKEFFDNLTRNLDGWETNVEVVSDSVGAQVMSDGLPFGGLCFDEAANDIELVIGTDPANHQTHTLSEPLSVAFEGSDVGPGGVLDIEDASRTKTLIHFLRPCPVLAEYQKTEIVAVG